MNARFRIAEHFMRVRTEIHGWPGNSEATRALRQKTWTVILRCYFCHRRFTVHSVTLDRLALIPHAVECARCGALPSASPRNLIHMIIDMREEAHGETPEPDSSPPNA